MRSRTFHSKYLSQLFFETLNGNQRRTIFSITNLRVPYLNGGLFDNDAPEMKRIDFPSEYFHNLLEFLSSIILRLMKTVHDHEVGIDPEMLGHILKIFRTNKNKVRLHFPKKLCSICVRKFNAV